MLSRVLRNKRLSRDIYLEWRPAPAGRGPYNPTRLAPDDSANAAMSFSRYSSSSAPAPRRSSAPCRRYCTNTKRSRCPPWNSRCRCTRGCSERSPTSSTAGWRTRGPGWWTNGRTCTSPSTTSTPTDVRHPLLRPTYSIAYAPKILYSRKNCF